VIPIRPGVSWLWQRFTTAARVRMRHGSAAVPSAQAAIFRVTNLAIPITVVYSAIFVTTGQEQGNRMKAAFGRYVGSFRPLVLLHLCHDGDPAMLATATGAARARSISPPKPHFAIKIIAKNLRAIRPKPHSRWHLDEMMVSIAGRQMYMWRAVDSGGEVLEILVQPQRDKAAALRLLRKLLRRHGFVPTVIVTDKLRSYGAALREIGFSGLHEQGLRANNRAENLHQPLASSSRWCFGKTPTQAFLDAIPITKEKMIAA
jgi:hypothetical protein